MRTAIFCVLVLSLPLVACRPPLLLTDRCPDDPLARDCPSGAECSGPYECVAYCIRYYPDRADVPASGMGSWCDDPRLPDDYGDFCGRHPEVTACAGYCDDEPGRCDGGGDADADGEERDGDQGDGDQETGRVCRGSADCPLPTAPRCQDGGCVPCRGEADCEHLSGLGVCEAGTCVECVRPEDCDSDVECAVAACTSGMCVYTRDNDLDGVDCTTDCDDDDPSTYPGHAELCDGRDNDCDGSVEESFSITGSGPAVTEVGDHPSDIDIAWSGSVYAVVWCETSEPRAPTVVIVDDAGSVLHRVDLGPYTGGSSDTRCFGPKIAWSGADFGIIWSWSRETGLTRAVVGADGRVLLPAGGVPGAEWGRWPMDLAHNGVDRYALAYLGDSGDVEVVTLDADLEMASEPATIGVCDNNATLTAAGGDFRLACFLGGASGGALWSLAYSAAGDLGGFTNVASLSMVMDGGSAFIEQTDDGFLVGWVDTDPYRVLTRPLDRNGLALAPASVLAAASDIDRDYRYVTRVDAARPDPRGGASGLVVAVRAGVDYSHFDAYLLRVSPDGASIGSWVSMPLGDHYHWSPAEVVIAEAETGVTAALDHGTASVVTFETLDVCF